MDRRSHPYRLDFNTRAMAVFPQLENTNIADGVRLPGSINPYLRSGFATIDALNLTHSLKKFVPLIPSNYSVTEVRHKTSSRVRTETPERAQQTSVYLFDEWTVRALRCEFNLEFRSRYSLRASISTATSWSASDQLVMKRS